MKPTKLSIIIPVYNNAKYLKRCFDSILSQSNLDSLKVIIIDDGSIDESLTIIQEYCNSHSSIFSYKSVPNGGVSYARNVGLELVDTPFLTFLDSDDWVSSSLYEKCLNFIETNDYDFICCNFIEHWSNGVTKFVSSLDRIDRSRYYVANVVWNKIYKTSFWQRYNFKFTVGVRFEDVELIIRMCTKTKKIGHLNENCAIVNYDRTNINSFMNSSRDMISMEMIFKSLLDIYAETQDSDLLRFIATTYFFHLILFSGNPHQSWRIYCQNKDIFKRSNIESRISKLILIPQFLSADFVLKLAIFLINKLKINPNKL